MRITTSFSASGRYCSFSRRSVRTISITCWTVSWRAQSRCNSTASETAAWRICLGGNPADVFNFAPYPGGPAGDVDIYIKPSVVPGCFASGLPPSQAAVIAATQRPQAASVLQEPSGARPGRPSRPGP